MKIRTRGESDLTTTSAKIAEKKFKKRVCGGAKPGLSEKKKVYLSGNEVFLVALGKMFEHGGILISAACTVYVVLSYESLYPFIVMMAITMTKIVMMTIAKTITS